MSDQTFKAKDCWNKIGIVLKKNLEFYPGICLDKNRKKAFKKMQVFYFSYLNFKMY